MDEIFAAILGAIAELLFEVFLEFIAAAVLEMVTGALLTLFTGLAEAVKEGRLLAGIMYALLGALAGTLSLLFLPHPLIGHPTRFHGINLLVSPLITGFVLSALGGILSRLGKRVTPIATFRYGFAFALGMALIRFFFAK